MRSRFSALTAAVALAGVLALAGCSSTPSGGASSSTPSKAAGATPSASAAAALSCPSAGSASDAVQVTGSGSKEPTVRFPKTVSTQATQRTTVRAGSGQTVKEGDSVSIGYAMYDAASGKRLDHRGWTSDGRVVFPVDSAQVLPGFAEAVVCAKVGSRIAAVIPPAKAFGSAGQESLGVKGGDSIVFVADVVSVTPTKATGAAKALPSGFPQVTLASNGQPTVRIPATDAPKTLRIADREVGDGATVKSGDTVTVQYQGVLWRTGKVFDQSWGKGAPASFQTTQVVKGFGKALVGQKVGSQVVAIIPPSEGYGKTGSSGAGITGTDVMVFVIDVLATSHTAS